MDAPDAAALEAEAEELEHGDFFVVTCSIAEEGGMMPDGFVVCRYDENNHGDEPALLTVQEVELEAGELLRSLCRALNARQEGAAIYRAALKAVEDARALVADFRRATRDRVFLLTADEARRARGESLMDRADAMLGLTRSGEPAAKDAGR